VMYIPQL